MMRHSLTAIAAAALTLASCSKAPQWEVTGNLSPDAAGKTIYLQSASNGKWASIDSATVGENLTFSFKGQRPAYPDIFRLTIDGSTLYFPIDSVNTVTVDATAAKSLDKGRISGSHSADMMQRINDVLASTAVPAKGSEFSEETKRAVGSIMMENLGSIASYYAVNKVVGDVPLFNPAINFDKRLIGGVATQFMAQRPDDPKSQLLSSTAITNLQLYKSDNAPTNSIEATEIPFFEISLRDAKGQNKSLTDVWNANKVTVLNFTALTMPQAPALNITLNEIYEKYHDRGLEIYQVGCDDDEFGWEAGAKNLPWVAVYNSPVNNASNLLNYNVAVLPTTFVISGDGSRMERVTDLSTLDKTVASML